MGGHTDRYYRNSIAGAQLSDISKKGYNDRLNVLKKMFPGRSIHYMLTNPAEVVHGLTARYSEAHTVKAFVNSMLTIFKHTPGLRASEELAYREWRGVFDEVHEEAEQRYATNAPSARQQDAYVPWAAVLAARDALPSSCTSLEHLWLCCHTMIPPIRADLDSVRIASHRVEWPNYLLVRPRSMELVLREFKTSGLSGNKRKTTVYSKELPDPLVRVIAASLKSCPRDFLIVSPKTGQPFSCSQTYTNWANRMLHRVFAPHDMTISMLRHSFITSLDHNTLTSGEKEELARSMMHSPAMFDRYRIIFPKS